MLLDLLLQILNVDIASMNSLNLSIYLVTILQALRYIDLLCPHNIYSI